MKGEQVVRLSRALRGGGTACAKSCHVQLGCEEQRGGQKQFVNSLRLVLKMLGLPSIYNGDPLSVEVEETRRGQETGQNSLESL